jgi:hypothetical protein
MYYLHTTAAPVHTGLTAALITGSAALHSSSSSTDDVGAHAAATAAAAAADNNSMPTSPVVAAAAAADTTAATATANTSSSSSGSGSSSDSAVAAVMQRPLTALTTGISEASRPPWERSSNYDISNTAVPRAVRASQLRKLHALWSALAHSAQCTEAASREAVVGGADCASPECMRPSELLHLRRLARVVEHGPALLPSSDQCGWHFELLAHRWEQATTPPLTTLCALLSVVVHWCIVACCV